MTKHVCSTKQPQLSVINGNLCKSSENEKLARGRSRSHSSEYINIRKRTARYEAIHLAASYIIQARKFAKLKQYELAEKLGVGASRISDIENMRCRSDGSYDSISLPFLLEVQDVTGLSLIVKPNKDVKTDNTRRETR